MGIALLAASALAQPLTALHRWWSSRHAALAPQCPPPSGAIRAAAPRTRPSSAEPCTAGADCRTMPFPQAAYERPATASGRMRPPDGRALHAARHLPENAFPLRVLHAHRSGRMAISGRMAEVCAELDRLAASELRH